MAAGLPFDAPSPFATGQGLVCQGCGAEVEVITPCPRNPPAQVLRCCGQDMVPSEPTPERLRGE